MKFNILLLLALSSFASIAQDQIKIMYYNILNFPGATPQRVDTLKKIIQYAEPDVFVVNELESNTGANSILNNALNQNGVTSYQKAAFVNGPDTDNMLYYNSDKLELSSQKQISTTLRDISEYVLFYKDPNIGQEEDTIFYYFYSLHLKAGSTDEFQRNIECTTLRNYLNEKSNLENVFVGGDFNFYNSSEPGYSTLVNSSTLKLNDPVFLTGNWHENSNYKVVHTQSTRTTALSDGSGGGMDDRFDFIFVSDDVLSGVNGVDYVNNTYRALGQDGIRLNQSINIPTNTLLPADIARALFFMSDHLPVMMTVDVNYTSNKISENKKLKNLAIHFNNELNQFILSEKLPQFNFKLIDLKGQVIFERNNVDGSLVQLDSLINNGIYLCQIETSAGFSNYKITINK
jgi:hypothetical protein